MKWTALASPDGIQMAVGDSSMATEGIDIAMVWGMAMHGIGMAMNIDMAMGMGNT